MADCKSLPTSLFQREAAPLFEKEGPGEIFDGTIGPDNYEIIHQCFCGRGFQPRSSRQDAAPTFFSILSTLWTLEPLTLLF
jgi:hypothetical protein